jgi:hypothetical protein
MSVMTMFRVPMLFRVGARPTSAFGDRADEDSECKTLRIVLAYCRKTSFMSMVVGWIMIGRIE